MKLNCVFGQAFHPVPARDLATEHRAHNTVAVADGQHGPHLFLALQRWLAQPDQVLLVDRQVQSVILRHLAVGPHRCSHLRLVEDVGEIQSPGFPMIHRLFDLQAVDVSHHLVQRAETQLRHQFADFLGNKPHEVDHVIRLAGEILAQLRILRRHAHRAGVEMADAHHDAAQNHQRRRGETKFLRPQQRGDHHIAPRLQLAVGLHNDAASQVVEQERLMRFRQPQFPGNARVLDARQGRCARAAIIAADQHHIGMGLGHTRSHGAHTHFGHQFDADPRPVIGVLKVVNQFRQVFNRVNVVMRRRRYEPHPRR